jgi:5-methylcytosine-specific restriction endonuclease McrA
VTIKDAPYLGIAEPIENNEIAKAYWQTVASVADIGKAIGITWARTIKDEAGPARLKGIHCSSCKDEVVVSCRTDAVRPIKDHQSGEDYALKRIRCEDCEDAYRAERRARSNGTAPRAQAPVQEPAPLAHQPGKQEKTDFYQSWEWRTLRVKVLQQYGARCMCCGAAPEHVTVGGEPVMIVVDHIKPLSKRWDLRLDRNNLQVLCQECNQGKGAWDETDFRVPPKNSSGDVLQ